jgi:hypothetical protein
MASLGKQTKAMIALVRSVARRPSGSLAAGCVGCHESSLTKVSISRVTGALPSLYTPRRVCGSPRGSGYALAAADRSASRIGIVMLIAEELQLAGAMQGSWPAVPELR